jgi:CDP-glucose 4,6-dehydratase
MKMPNTSFWNQKRVLVTGHTGFKGSWLSLWLNAMGAELRGLALAPPTKLALFEVARVAEVMDHQIVDVRNKDNVAACIQSFAPEIIFHMAAQPLVRASYENPVETYATNVMGTVHLLEAARQCESVKTIVNVTTDKCYENKEWHWGYREIEPMGGYDPYSSSKGCSELVSSAYQKSFFQHHGISLATARAGNVIGGGDWAHDRLVPDILRALEQNKPVQIRNPDAIRPWQHVLEPLSGYLILAETLYHHGSLFAEPWNFGPRDSDAKPVRSIASMLCKLWGANATWEESLGEHPHEARYLKLDISKAHNGLNWQPKLSLETALELVTQWHQAWLSGNDMRAFCLKQISDYQGEE